MDGRTRCASDNVHSLRKRLVLGLGWAPNEELIPQLWICQELGKGAYKVVGLLCQILGRLKNDGSGPANIQATFKGSDCKSGQMIRGLPSAGPSDKMSQASRTKYILIAAGKAKFAEAACLRRLPPLCCQRGFMRLVCTSDMLHKIKIIGSFLQSSQWQTLNANILLESNILLDNTHPVLTKSMLQKTP